MGSPQRVWVRLQPEGDPEEQLVSRVAGERVFSSGHPAMQQLKPSVYDLVVVPR